jgi:hypothetical protein
MNPSFALLTAGLAVMLSSLSCSSADSSADNSVGLGPSDGAGAAGAGGTMDAGESPVVGGAGGNTDAGETPVVGGAGGNTVPNETSVVGSAGGTTDAGVSPVVGGAGGTTWLGDTTSSGKGTVALGGSRGSAGAQAVGGSLSANQSPEKNLLKMESVQVVSYNPPQVTTFILDRAYTITRIWTYHYASTIGNRRASIALKDIITGGIFGPWPVVGYRMFNGSLGATKNDPGNIAGPPDDYWMAYPGVIVPPGNYQVIDSDPATWAYTADLADRGVCWVYGY